MAARCETCDYHLERLGGEFVCLYCSHRRLVALERQLARVGAEFRADEVPPGQLPPFDHGNAVLHLGIPDASQHGDSEYWVVQLRTWHANGTFARMHQAMEARQPVQVRRSDGTVSVGVITATAGFGGRSIEVEVETPEGKRYKNTDTDDFLELNPGFGPHLRELRPRGDVAALPETAPPAD